MYGNFPAKNTVCTLYVRRVGQNRISAPHMTVCMVISLLKYRMYTVCTYKCMVLANTIYTYKYMVLACSGPP